MHQKAYLLRYRSYRVSIRLPLPSILVTPYTILKACITYYLGPVSPQLINYNLASLVAEKKLKITRYKLFGISL